MILGRESVVLDATTSPDDFDQERAQAGLAFGRLAPESLGATLFVAWTDSRPRSQVLG